MKIESLRLKNLNSLYGEWSIDFTVPEFTANGIFAITGPTGAGKSTLLDGICLALYGRTPRLDRINKGGNEVMSRGTGECAAEVVFSSGHGRFCCHFSHHRARKKADGRLADAKHEIADADSGKVLATKKREVARLVEQFTGMDFDRFTRSILLAQGGFAAFLQATPDKRAPVLEQITGTKIYSEISCRVHERLREEQKKLELLQAATQGISVLSAEEEQQLVCRHQVLEQQEKDMAGKAELIAAAIQWQSELASLEQELASCVKEAEEVQTAQAGFASKRKRLESGRRAAELEAEFAALAARRQLQQQEQNALSKEERELPALEQKRATLEKAATELSGQLEQIKKVQQSEAALGKEVRGIDLKRGEKVKEEKRVVQEQNKNKKLLARRKHTRKQLAAKLAGAEKEQEKTAHYLAEHGADAGLVSRFSAIDQQLQQLLTSGNDLLDKKKEAARAQAELTQARQQQERHQHHLADCKKRHEEALGKTKALQQEQNTLLAGQLPREYRAELENLNEKRVLLQRIATLEDDRNKLVDDSPCPLCGSLDHPYAQGNIPEPDEVEKRIRTLSGLLEQITVLDEEIKKQQLQEKQTVARLGDAEKKVALAGECCRQADNTMLRLQEELQTLEKNSQKLRKHVLENLSPFGISDLFENDIESLSCHLRTRLETWQYHVEKKQAMAGDMEGIRADIIKEDAALSALLEHIDARAESLAEIRAEREQLERQRHELYGKKDPDEQEAQLIRQVDEAEKSLLEKQKTRDELQEQIAGVKSRIQTLKDSTDARKPILHTLAQDFQRSCVQAGFADESTFAREKLAADELQSLEQQAKKLDERLADVAARRKDRQEKLAAVQAKQITTLAAQELKKQHLELSVSLKKLREESGAIKQELRNNSKAVQQLKTQQKKIAGQQQESVKWQKLHSLIGSADGKKYRNFAQGITFELMVAHANQQLDKMTDRYLLIRDPHEPLELNVVDNYQAAEVRSTKNLSGGESFIVSLALALGLSQMAGRKTRVDSLFLDEGFGTLDEEALETSLETLAGLNRQGKLIGIISHIPALKERIAAQIVITPVSGGRSVVSGPGCQG